MAKDNPILRGETVRGSEAVISYAADLFKARANTNNADKIEFGCTLIYKKGCDLGPLEKAALDVAEAMWPGKPVRDWFKDGTIRSPFLDGDGKEGRDRDGNTRKELVGSRFIRCSSGQDYKPKVVDRKRNPVYSVEDCPSGSRGLPVVTPLAYDHPKGGKGVKFSIDALQVTHVATGDEVLGGGGGPDPDKWFEKLEDTGDAPETTKGGAGAAGLFG